MFITILGSYYKVKDIKYNFEILLNFKKKKINSRYIAVIYIGSL